MDVYKFMPRARVEGFLKGNLWCGRLRYYRLLELALGDPFIGDQYEGLQATRVSLVDRDDDANAVIIEHIKDFIRVPKGATIKDSIVVKEIDGFVLCCSAGELEQLARGVRDGCFGSADYDACLLIRGAEDFARALWQEGQFAEGATTQAVSDAFEEPVCDVVTYDLEEADIRHGAISDASPFRKRREPYSGQSEWRIFFKPKDKLPWDMDHLVIACPPAVMRAFVNEQETGLPSAPDPTPAAPKRDYLRALIDIHARWELHRDLWRTLDKLMEPEYGDESTSGPWKAYREHMMTLGAHLGDLFDRRYRRELTKAYFEVRRDGHKDQRMDEGIFV